MVASGAFAKAAHAHDSVYTPFTCRFGFTFHGATTVKFRLQSLHIMWQVPLSRSFLSGPFSRYRRETRASHNILNTQRMLHTFHCTAPISFDPARLHVPVVPGNHCI